MIKYIFISEKYKCLFLFYCRL